MHKPHAVCLPFPAQGHINPMMQLAKLLHSRGFYITFVNTEFVKDRLALFHGTQFSNGFEDFRMESIADGLAPEFDRVSDLATLLDASRKYWLNPFRELVLKLNQTAGIPKVRCIVSEWVLNFSKVVADEIGVPRASLITNSASSCWGYLQIPDLIQRGIIPFKDESLIHDKGYLDTTVDWIPGMPNIRLRDLPTFIRTTNLHDFIVQYCKVECQEALRSSALILNTFYELEKEVLNAVKASFLCPMYALGPLISFSNHESKDQLKNTSMSLWNQESECLDWLEKQKPRSVLFVSFGSMTIVTPQQLNEFAWGLANCLTPFIWIIREDLVKGEGAILSEEFTTETKERGFIARWCDQARVLSHASVGGFFTHCGWNSCMESICHGVPMICWPVFADQQMNCRYICHEWGIGMEIEGEVNREKVEALVKALMNGEKSREMRLKAMEWKDGSERAFQIGGSSYLDFEKLMNEVLLKGQPMDES
ncbi:hypothetical protein AMTRI_Chr04g245320 [Amborella trichopoda]